MSKMTIVEGDDWVGLYIEDVLIDEGHGLAIGDVAQAVIDHNVTEVETKTPNQSWLEAHGSLPLVLSEVIWHDEMWINLDAEGDE